MNSKNLRIFYWVICGLMVILCVHLEWSRKGPNSMPSSVLPALAVV